MADSSAIRYLQIAKQDAGVTEVPGSTEFNFVDFQGDPIYADSAPNKVEVQLQRDDGEMAEAVEGQRTGGINFTTLIRGTGDGASDEVSSDPAELSVLMDVACGFDGQLGTGTVCDGTTQAVGQLDVEAGDGAQFKDGTSGTDCPSALIVNSSQSIAQWEAREVTGVSTDALTLDRDLQGVPAAAAPVYAATSWYIDADNPEHDTVYADIEGTAFRDILLGCGANFTINMDPTTPLAQIEWALMANDIDYDDSLATPTYSAPTSAGGIPVKNCPFWWGSTKTTLRSLSIASGLDLKPKKSTEGAQGNAGWLYEYSGAKISGELYYDHTIFKNAQGSTADTVDVAVQIGPTSASDTDGNCLYVRIPNMQLMGMVKASADGVDVMQFEGVARRPSAGNGSIRFHLFGG